MINEEKKGNVYIWNCIMQDAHFVQFIYKQEESIIYLTCYDNNIGGYVNNKINKLLTICYLY